MYAALSETPMEVGDDDVTMIMEEGEWITYVKPKPASPSSVEHDTPDAPELEPDVSDVAFGHETTLPPPSRAACRAWLWWLALPAVAGVWLVFRLKKRRK
ncbi:MAG: hypothetical protein FWF96_07340 [Kiritimatiellaeota bacterium]|nr:hypothetical protein [Kiritimatiellota bacterium]